MNIFVIYLVPEEESPEKFTVHFGFSVSLYKKYQ